LVQTALHFVLCFKNRLCKIDHFKFLNQTINASNVLYVITYFVSLCSNHHMFQIVQCIFLFILSYVLNFFFNVSTLVSSPNNQWVQLSSNFVSCPNSWSAIFCANLCSYHVMFQHLMCKFLVQIINVPRFLLFLLMLTKLLFFLDYVYVSIWCS
jgi:hypothetical protein